MRRHYSRTYLAFGESLVPPEKAKKFQVIIQGYTAKTKRFYLLYVFRIILLAIISAALVSTPITQAVFNTLISLAMVFYVIKKKPIKRRINHIQLVCLETIVLITNFCMVLVSMKKDDTLTTSGVFFGDLVVLGNFCAHALILGFLITKFILIAKEVSKLYKVKKDLAKIACINFLLAYLQQGAFGFEEILQLDLTPPEKTPDDEKTNLVHDKNTTLQKTTQQYTHLRNNDV